MTQPRIRSTQFSAGYVSAAGTYRLVLMGPGSTAIIKSIYFTQTAGGPMNAQFYTVNGASVTVLIRHDFTGASDARWDGWAVLNDGDQLRIVCDGAQPSWVVSGTLLGGTFDGTTTPAAAINFPLPAVDAPIAPAASKRRR